VVVLVSFNLASSFARKNPFAAIAAFRGAFGDRPDRILVLKIGHPEHAPADFARLAQMVRAPNIRLETQTLPPEDRHALTACADIVLSLHRGEGFGLVLAEAMLLGKPVIATGWSGNTDFMDATNAALVSYRLVPARDDRSVYRGLWAEPDVAEAATLLRRLADDADLRRNLGERARASTLSRLDGRELTAALERLT
jgi:glycosyltransferase involved in cell wall biosynthesis